MLYRYYVEGECEKKLINTFKTKADNREPIFISGKVYVFNVLDQDFSINQFRDITEPTTLILIYDTDQIDNEKKNRLKRNIDIALSRKRIKKIIHVQSVKNFEDEILRCSKIKRIDDIFNTQGANAFKRKFISCDNIESKLKTLDFNFDKLWISKPNDLFFASLLEKNGADIKK